MPLSVSGSRTPLTRSILLLLFGLGGLAAATVEFQASSENFPNPERGFFVQAAARSSDGYAPLGTGYLANLRSAQAMSLVRRLYSLAPFRNAPLSQQVLDCVRDDCAAARSSGFKLDLRFAYAFNEPDGSTADAPLSRILAHIAQLKPIFQANGDVIAFMDAGFIGNWGEWHSSTNGNGSTDAKRQVLFALLDALPADRCVALRYQSDKKAIFGTDQPLSLQQAFDGSRRARTGHKNDCFLASTGDMGTYWPLDAAGVEAQKAYLAAENRFVPQSGETCRPNPPRSDSPTALAELDRMRWSALNSDFHREVLDSWKADGSYPEIARRLGYRYRLRSATAVDAVARGETLSVELVMRNDGFAGIYNPRAVELVLRHRSSGAVHRIRKTGVEERLWLPDSGSSATLAIAGTLPTDLALGRWDLLLAMPDPAPGLRGDPRYAIRLANTGIWNASTGEHALGLSVEVTAADAPGDDPLAAEVVYDPEDANGWDMGSVELRNHSASTALARVELALDSGVFDHVSHGAIATDPDLGGNNDGRSAAQVALTLSGGLAAGGSLRADADIDGSMGRISARVVFADGRSLEGVLVDVGDRDDGDARRLVWDSRVADPAPLALAINFQPATAPVPAGWLVDAGAAFGDRGNGQRYGWDQANDETRDRNVDGDQLRDTLNHFSKRADRTWELALPDGVYEVDLLCGDPSYTDQVNHLLVEGVRAADPDGQDPFDRHVVTVTVADGRLTIRPAADALNAKLNRIVVTAIGGNG